MEYELNKFLKIKSNNKRREILKDQIYRHYYPIKSFYFTSIIDLIDFTFFNFFKYIFRYSLEKNFS